MAALHFGFLVEEELAEVFLVEDFDAGQVLQSGNFRGSVFGVVLSQLRLGHLSTPQKKP
jgi:hypothetical protein